MNMHGDNHLQVEQARLLAVKQKLNRDANLKSDEGKLYVRVLVKLVMIQSELEAQKEKR
jgi:hypothetical protein